MDEGTGRYAAFLSYSHKDAAAARWLHRRLETYRIPKRLVGKEGERGPLPKRLTPIFRDREELPAAGDLSARVRAALAASENLIILCSPNAAASPWVAKEIAAFRELHPDRPVFAAIVEGEPSECFPHNLAAGGGEPLAADLRPCRDGRRLGFLKLVAGLSGVGLDALVQRDAQRRIRSVTAVTAAALAAMLVMAVLTGLALSERREAQRQRAEAEGLVEFMLTDLRTKLRGVGRLDIMDAVNDRTLQHYRNDSDVDMPTDMVVRRARTLNAIGEDEVLRGRMSAALKSVSTASAIVSARLSQAPYDPKLQLERARGIYWSGRLHELRGEWPQALRSYEEFDRAVRLLVHSSPNNPDFLNEVGWSTTDLGNIYLNGFNKPAIARAYYREGISWFERTSRIRPADLDMPRVIANAYANLADSYYAEQNWRNSLQSRLKQYELLAGMHRADPANADLAYRLAAAERGLAVSYSKVGDSTRYREKILDAYYISHRLVRLDAANGDWLFLTAAIDCNLFFGTPWPSPSIRSADLQNEVKEIEASLLANKNPLARQLSRCTHGIQNVHAH